MGTNCDRKELKMDILTEQYDEPVFAESDEQGEDLQLAENAGVEQDDDNNEYDKRRELLKKTKIVRQTWSILEIVQKLKEGTLILNPDYQRSVVWNTAKKTSFIESLYMGIMIPPIYVVEIPGEDVLDVNRYEVVDGKQRLTAIQDYIRGRLTLDKKSLEYYRDIFGGKKFPDIRKEYGDETSEMLSSILDIYVITSISPEFTKYDIFARLNKGAEKLKVNEIRRAIYHSNVSEQIKNYIDENYKHSFYTALFSTNDIKRFEDYGRFYKSVAFYIQTNKEKQIVDGYNARPRDMINTVLQNLQEGKLNLPNEKVSIIISKTIELMQVFNGEHEDYLVDMCIPFIDDWDKLSAKFEVIKSDSAILDSLKKSPATTSNVNGRVKRIMEILQ